MYFFSLMIVLQVAARTLSEMFFHSPLMKLFWRASLILTLMIGCKDLAVLVLPTEEAISTTMMLMALLTS